ncbi:MAG: hypothetical protein KAJ95_10695 [Gammaproteobacteria bacterium]|nr:hypothetical protein [Gammaproteobacteria bacterium]
MHKQSIFIIKPFIFSVLFLFFTSTLAQDVSPQQQDSAVEAWPFSAKHDGFNISVSPISPDRIRAFFTGRGFPAEMIESLASHCIIGTRIENSGSTPFSYDLVKWRYITADGKQHKLKIKSDWIKEWRAQGIKFAFSQLADNPTFLSGDWISSMTTYKLPPGSSFDLHYQWNIDGKDNMATFKGVKCAED